MAKKKHPFHCEKCNSECMIYKKGKGHRVFVCPECGVLATNGRGIIRKVAKGLLRSVPVVGDVTAELISKDSTQPLSKVPLQHRPYNSHSLDRIKYALSGK
jgi:hypothetical protein